VANHVRGIQSVGIAGHDLISTSAIRQIRQFETYEGQAPDVELPSVIDTSKLTRRIRQLLVATCNIIEVIIRLLNFSMRSEWRLTLVKVVPLENT
jgi:hypothetical protein